MKHGDPFEVIDDGSAPESAEDSIVRRLRERERSLESKLGKLQAVLTHMVDTTLNACSPRQLDALRDNDPVTFWIVTAQVLMQNPVGSVAVHYQDGYRWTTIGEALRTRWAARSGG